MQKDTRDLVKLKASYFRNRFVNSFFNCISIGLLVFTTVFLLPNTMDSLELWIIWIADLIAFGILGYIFLLPQNSYIILDKEGFEIKNGNYEKRAFYYWDEVENFRKVSGQLPGISIGFNYTTRGKESTPTQYSGRTFDEALPFFCYGGMSEMELINLLNKFKSGNFESEEQNSRSIN
ncbi:MAG: hypothetical protein ACK481_05400 [Candidatus Melainabacteria bacterium]|jgi:hypothetical protein